MNYVTGQFVVLPEILAMDQLKIKYTDLMVYISLRSFDGWQGCYPAYETIAKRARCSRDYVIKAISRLEQAGFIEVERSDKKKESNKYRFVKFHNFERIPYTFFSLGNKLTLYERSVLLCLRQLLWHHGKGMSIMTIADIAKRLGLSYRQVYKPLTSLINKGYLVYRKERSGKTYTLADKFEWIFDYNKPKPSFGTLKAA